MPQTSETEPSQLLLASLEYAANGIQATVIDSVIETKTQDTSVLAAWLIELWTLLFNFIMHHWSNSRGTL